MESNYIREKQYMKAQKRVQDIKGFYVHLVVTIFIIPFLIFINLKFAPEFHWFWFATVGMLLGLIFHWLGVFGFEKLGLGKNWEDKKIKEFMDQDNRLKYQ